MRDFNGVILFFSIKCPRNFTRVRKNVVCLRLLSCFHFLVIVGTVLVSCLVFDCMKTSSKYVIAFFLSISGLKFLLINAEKAAGPMDVP